MPKIEGVKPKKQQTRYTCGPASLRTIFYYYGIRVSEQELVDTADVTEEGTSEYQMRQLAHEYGFSFYGRANGHLKDVAKFIEKGIPILICYQDWGKPTGNNGHYAVLTGIDKDWVEIADPANHNGTPIAHSKRMQKDNFMRRWFEDEIDDSTGEKQRVRRWFAIIRPKKKKKK
jgi:ABC-type bacteriocin/lantibiotic exporter with double-glycine peptidase domain